jgi:hypothetical protein
VKGKAFVITFLILLSTAGAYWVYTEYVDQKSLTMWDLVPSSAVAVYDKGKCEECADSVLKTPMHSLVSIGLLSNYKNDSSVTNSLRKLTRQASLVSMHKTTWSRFDVVYYLEKLNAEKVWINLENGFKKRSAKFSIRNRVLNGVSIRELTLGTSIITWADIEDFRVISMTPILVEDVIRTTQDEIGKSFKNWMTGVGSISTVKSDGGDVFFKLNEFVGSASLFTNSPSALLLGNATVLDVKKVDQSLVLNGFTDVDSSDHQSLLSFFQEQDPVPFELKKYVSNDAHYMLNLGISDGVAFGKRLRTVLPRVKQDSLSAKLRLTKATVARLFETIGTEVGLFSMESPGSASSRLLLINTKGFDFWQQTFDGLAERTKVDTFFVEQFSEYTIKKISTSGLVEFLFPTIIEDFDAVYYTQAGATFMLAGDIVALKMALEHIDQENTWGKSVEKNRFLETTLLESNVSFYADPAKTEKLLLDGLNEEWKKSFIENRSLYRNLNFSAVQFSHLNDNFYTHANLTFSKRRVVNKEISSHTELVVSLSSGIFSAPIVVKNHNDKKFEILLQDSTQTLYLINKGGEIAWQRKLDGLIQGDVEQIDFFANGKLQYLMATDKSVYIIDRLGNSVNPFPTALNFIPEHLYAVDYDHSKKYRFLFADKKGVLRMMDMQSQFLDGWKELNTGSELLSKPRHHRIAGKDYVSVLQKNGLFVLYSRRGELLKNFPVDLKGRPRGDYYLRAGDRNEKPHFVFVLAEGLRVKLDLNGKEISRETMVKPLLDTNFKLVKEEKEKAYVIVQQDNKNLAIINDQLQTIVTNDFVGLNSVEVAYYDFGAGHVFYTVVDSDQDLGYVYDGEGKLLNVQPFECHSMSLVWEQNQVRVAVTYGSSLRISSLQ